MRSTASSNDASGATPHGSDTAVRRAAYFGMRRRPTVMIVQSAVILTDRVSRQNSRLPLSTWVQSFETPVEEGGGVGARARQADQWRYDSCRQIGWSEPRGCHDFQRLDLGGHSDRKSTRLNSSH